MVKGAERNHDRRAGKDLVAHRVAMLARNQPGRWADPRPMRNSTATPLDPPPLTPEDEGTLAEYLAAHSSYDLHGAVGLMHAVASSPLPLPFEAWRPVVQRDHRLTEFRHLLSVASTTVALELGRRRPFPPPAGDPAACASFARGYLDGLELWPASVPRVDRVRCGAWACALGARLDLLPPEDQAKFRLTQQGRAALRREIGRFMLLTYDLYALAPGALSLLDAS